MSTLSLVSFFSSDACIDAGGLSSNFGLICEGLDSDFVPQYKRVAPVFWCMVFLLSGLASFLVAKVMQTARP